MTTTQPDLADLLRQSARTCPCGLPAANARGVPRCAECRQKNRRSYHQKRNQTRETRRVPPPGTEVTVACQWCEQPFTFVSRGAFRTKCDGCKRVSGAALRAAWQKANPDKRYVVKMRYRLSRNGQVTETQYNRGLRFAKYGRDDEWFTTTLASQGGCCAVCGTDEPGGRHNAWCIDHDRSCCQGSKSCGACVRAILCSNCNLGLGLFRDDPSRLAAAIRYLKAHQLHSASSLKEGGI